MQYRVNDEVIYTASSSGQDRPCRICEGQLRINGTLMVRAHTPLPNTIQTFYARPEELRPYQKMYIVGNELVLEEP